MIDFLGKPRSFRAESIFWAKPRKHHFHRRLTEDIGHPRLQEHLAAVEALMKVSTDDKQFKSMLDIALPIWDDQKRLTFNY